MVQRVTEPTFEELYAQIRALPENLTGEVLVPGVLRTMGRPGKPHRRAARQCQHSLDSIDANIGGSGWWIEVEAEVRLSEGRLVVPDLIGFRVERVPQVPNENPLTIVPDWCCEVLSRSTAQDDLGLKLPLFARSGVPWTWIVDPSRRLIEVFESVGGRPALTATAMNDERVAFPPFGIEIDAGPFWLDDAEQDRDA